MANNEDTELLEIPGDFVGLDYIMDPKIDDVIPGSLLKDGMLVLAEMNSFRGDPRKFNDTNNPYERPRIMETARWCKVTHLRFNDRDQSTFIGLYGDGTKFPRTYHIDHYWLVKKSSMS